MKYYAKEGQHFNGYPIGIMTFEELFLAQIPGVVGNATTYGFPVLYKTIENYSYHYLFEKKHEYLSAIIETAKWLENEGVRAISADCGFFALYQREVAEAVDIPVFLSSMLQVPLLSYSIKSNEKIGILTADASTMDDAFLRGAGIMDNSKIAVHGLQDKPNFACAVLEQVSGILDTDVICKEVVEGAKELVEEDPAVKIILLECTELPPYAYAIQEALHLPVYDFYTMINYAFTGLVRRPFDGFM